MPQIANITVKKNDGTTDVVYTAVVASAGDKSQAIWQNQTVGTADSHRPDLKMQSRSNQAGTARRVEMVYTYPSLVTGSDGRTNIADKVIVEVNVVLPRGMALADRNEAVAQGLNLASATLVKDSVKSGFAPT